MICEDMLIRIPALFTCARVDTKNLLEANIHSLGETDCSRPGRELSNIDKHGWLMNALLNRQRDEDTRPSVDTHMVNYRKDGSEKDSFPDRSLLESIDGDQHDDICRTVSDIEKTAKQKGLADAHESKLKGILRVHIEIFCRSFSAGQPVNFHCSISS